VDPRPAGDFLRDILKQAGTGKARRVYVEALEEILGADFAPHFQIFGCRKGRLVVELDSAPLFAELSGFRREEIRQRPIAQLTFRLGGTGRR
jgi:hypothetical protein